MGVARDTGSLSKFELADGVALPKAEVMISDSPESMLVVVLEVALNEYSWLSADTRIKLMPMI